MVDGQLLRMDKQFRHLKQRQQETISYWLYGEYRHQWLEIGQEPLPRDTGRIVDAVMEKIKAAGIWIPEQDVRPYFSAKSLILKTESRRSWTVLQVPHPRKAQKAEEAFVHFLLARWRNWPGAWEARAFSAVRPVR